VNEQPPGPVLECKDAFARLWPYICQECGYFYTLSLLDRINLLAQGWLPCGHTEQALDFIHEGEILPLGDEEHREGEGREPPS
jgi:hypothetical protein